MPFIRIPGLPGKLYVPEHNPAALKKHPCPGCFSCQMCSDDRCRVCLHQEEKKRIPSKPDEN